MRYLSAEVEQFIINGSVTSSFYRYELAFPAFAPYVVHMFAFELI